MWKDRASGRVEMFSKEDEKNESKEDQENEELIYDINVNDFLVQVRQRVRLPSRELVCWHGDVDRLNRLHFRSSRFCRSCVHCRR